MAIHPTAIVDSGAKLGADVEIGAYSKIGADVTLGDGVVVASHVVIEGETTIGDETQIYPFAYLGGPPQHLGYRGEQTRLEIGVKNIIREQVTMNIGTAQGGGITRVGDRGMFMVGAHIAHDCHIGNDVIFANNATLGGHVTIGKNVFLGGLCAIHQNCRIGDYAFIGGCAAVPCDVIPYASASGNHADLVGLNIIGMKRRGMDRKSIHALRGAYRMLFNGEGNFKDRLGMVREQYGDHKEVVTVLDFIEYDASRSLMTPRR